MQNDEAVRCLCIDTLLDDRKKGWAKAASTANVRDLYPEKSDHELLNVARLAASEAWAYRDELEALTSDELRRRAGAATERLRLEREAADRQRLLDEQEALYGKWARKPFWTRQEAVFLLLGADPDGSVAKYECTDEWDDLTDLLERAIKAGKLKRDMSPAALLAFLHGVKVDVPAGLAKAVAALRPAKPASKPAPEVPAEQAPKAPAVPFVDIPGYDCPPDLAVMLEAINQFWVNADPDRRPKQEAIVDWIKPRVGDSANRAKAIDMLIRPEWARLGGNTPQAKG